VRVPEVGRQLGQLALDVDTGAVPVDHRARREAMPKVLVMPTSAQPRLCRPVRYADFAENVLLRAVLEADVSA
jgi:hypothetical protein